jgi:hypothetical protein
MSNGVILRLRVQPNASKSEFVGTREGRLKVRVRAKPLEGEANEAVRRFIAKTTGVPVSRIAILRGERSREKDILIECADPEAVAGRINGEIGEGKDI